MEDGKGTDSLQGADLGKRPQITGGGVDKSIVLRARTVMMFAEGLTLTAQNQA
ncbi:hypothetical protein [Deinococcus sp.]|uniref:hypothetical protein n=1 Tax=Deinococcus sp. TaxID=47478 RepID=UPI003CC6BEFE